MIDSPWLTHTDRASFGRTLDELRALEAWRDAVGRTRPGGAGQLLSAVTA